ncbi:MAG: 50S ribosomal protein L13 [Oligoflexales bacterium]
MKTHNVKPADIKKKWLVVDATDKCLGRIASQIAHVLRGKHKATFTPHLDCGDNIIVVNAEKIRLSKDKFQSKEYHHHTGYIGGIKTASAKEILETYPDRLITTAVKGMLPRNKLGRRILKNLWVYAGGQHPHEAQKPEAMQERTIGRNK